MLTEQCGAVYICRWSGKRQQYSASEREFSIVTGHTVTNKLFLEIAKKQEWVGTEHMEVIMTMLWRRRGEVLVKDRAVFVESAFTSLVASMYPVFKICDDKSAFDWGNNVRSFVSDIPGSYVEVLDPYVDYNHKEAVVEAYMEPVVQSMPWILKRVGEDRWFREKYAMDCYEEFVGKANVANK
ncbi:unnamed protein product [Microthlaspi erraticum]|uniref:Uncharacterized protein n=1 Tax=Microthlaspi erraticum TaxID=1685480 RepID=A0A6D2IJC1_9BRAS|nr:unnamed protein product [Microthlaspi erraticum]